MIIANFTPDRITWMHVGICGDLEPGDIKEFDEARGNHILNKYGPKGLLRLEYGDDKEDKRDQAMRLWRSFWERQITVFNQANDARRNENRPYSPPSKDLVEHAERLGIELIQPWAVKKSGPGAEEIEEIRKDNQALRDQVAALAALVEKLAGAGGTAGGDNAAVAPATATDVESGISDAAGAIDTTPRPIDPGGPIMPIGGDWDAYIEAFRNMSKRARVRSAKAVAQAGLEVPDHISLVLQGIWAEANMKKAYGRCPI